MFYPVKHENGTRDKRYTITQEHCGHSLPRYVVRFCGDFVGSFSKLPQATLRAIGHNKARQGGAIVAME